jgi:hypothetical protein
MSIREGARVMNYHPYQTFILNLKSGDKVVGSFSVQGSQKIDFGVLDPSPARENGHC